MVKAVLGVPWDNARNVEKRHGYAEKGISGRRNGYCPKVLSFNFMPEIAVKTQKAKSGFFVKTCPLFPLEPKSSKKENRKNMPVILVKT